MIEETIINYSYVILSEYEDLEDGSPNFHHIPAMKIKGQGTMLEFLQLLSHNSKIEGNSIVEIDFKIHTDT
jgi:hypothetical protein